MNIGDKSLIGRERIKIGELCLASGYSKATIYQYQKMGLLPKPLKKGFRLSYYNDNHLRILGRIRYLREQEHLSLNQIKDELRNQESTEADFADMREDRREKILSEAVEHFARKGYRGTKISDITDALNISKGAFYLYFKDKKELFLDSIGKLTTVVVSIDRWKELRCENDPIRRMIKRTKIFMEEFQEYNSILDNIRLAMQSEDQSLVNKGKEALDLLSRPIIKDIAWGMKHGYFRKVDEKLVASLIFAMTEILEFRSMNDSICPIQERISAYFDLLSYGLLPRKQDIQEKTESEVCYCEITDKEGEKTPLRDIRFDNKEFLTGRLGLAEVKVDPGSMLSLTWKDVSAATVVINMKNGKEIIMKVDEKMSISGKCSLALLTISLKHVSQISFLSNQTSLPNDEGEIQNTATARKAEDDKRGDKELPE